jgi:hypothetical protein
MLRKFLVMAMMLVFAFGAVAIAGCGGNDEKSSGSSTTESTDTGSSTDSGDSGNVSDNPQVKAAVDQCKQAIDAQPALKDSTKTDLKDLCDKAASGDIKDAQEASKEVCKKIVEDTVPEGSARDQAEEACAAAAGG